MQAPSPQQAPPQRAIDYLAQCHATLMAVTVRRNAIIQALTLINLEHDFARLNLEEASSEWIAEYNATEYQSDGTDLLAPIDHPITA
jgi:hypothetical protein